MDQRFLAPGGLCLALSLGLGLAAGAARAEDPPSPTASPAAPAPATSTPATPAPAAADPAAARRDRREVNGHVFLPSLVDAPVAVSSFGIQAIFVAGSATGPVYSDLGERLGTTRDYTWGGMTQVIGFQTVFLDHLALRGNLTTSLASGLDGISALVVGTTVQAGAGLGAEWSMGLGETVRLGAALDVSSQPQINLLIAAAVLKAIDSGGVDVPALFELNNILTVAPSVSVAWAPTPALGVVASLAYGASRLETDSYGTVTRQAVTLGLAADVDLAQVWKVPVGVGLAYRESIPVDGTLADIRDASLSVMYTGKKDVAAGLMLGERELRIRPQYPEPLSASSGFLNVVLRIYWP